eukprot:Skav214579  [mRNA]  locus=scaffold57:213634:218367:+ [translate_table: standard]
MPFRELAMTAWSFATVLIRNDPLVTFGFRSAMMSNAITRSATAKLEATDFQIGQVASKEAPAALGKLDETWYFDAAAVAMARVAEPMDARNEVRSALASLELRVLRVAGDMLVLGRVLRNMIKRGEDDADIPESQESQDLDTSGPLLCATSYHGYLAVPWQHLAAPDNELGAVLCIFASLAVLVSADAKLEGESAHGLRQAKTEAGSLRDSTYGDGAETWCDRLFLHSYYLGLVLSGLLAMEIAMERDGWGWSPAVSIFVI